MKDFCSHSRLQPVKKSEKLKCALVHESTHGVLLSLYSLAIVSMPPPRATAMKQDSFPTSKPTTDIAASTDPLYPGLGVTKSLK